MSRRIFLLYHAVNDKIPAHLKHLYPIKSIENFEKDINFLLKNYQLSNLENLFESRLAETKNNEFVLSFDDGLIECYNFILPILNKYGIKAIFFINTKFIGNKHIFYRHQISILLDKIERSNNKSLGYSKDELDFLKKEIRRLNYGSQDRLFDLAKNLGVDFNEYLETHKPYMDWSQVLEISKAGHLIGAHSVDHPKFSEITDKEKEFQISKSFDTIQKHLQLKFRLFSFPFTDYGVSGSFINNMKERNQFDFCFGCAGLRNEDRAFHIQRIPVESRYLSLSNILTYQRIKAIVYRMVQQDKINRNQWS